MLITRVNQKDANTDSFFFTNQLSGRHNDQDHRAGGPTRVIVEKPKTLNEANAVEKTKT